MTRKKARPRKHRKKGDRGWGSENGYANSSRLLPETKQIQAAIVQESEADIPEEVEYSLWCPCCIDSMIMYSQEWEI